ncbi:hypothetical protein [Spiroplasma phoeniceum]|uniref:Transmembrane protein n=1 Tax=Spiroplasma phoeniceum P40 TaxID=1276259 RepID=A0A345DS13_9MOLU|nr:hypothetical protein [Spiroplasma phoeniceum]AXF97004.1 hypothetical protein SDAV_002071 [Spiroplasma phoeniceum P40]AXF97033.1 hypothetical protein SDAV_002100 [Spiroplasma phoeniceum P40]AXF97071.1 hypothetical protein SDAV_002138 [Spiroplasma phoeniceum P40]
MLTSTIGIIVIVASVVGGVVASLLIGYISKLIKNKAISVKAERITDDFRENAEEKIFNKIEDAFENIVLVMNDIKNHFGGVGTQNIARVEEDINDLKLAISDLEKYDNEELIEATLQHKATKRDITHKAHKVAGLKLKK